MSAQAFDAAIVALLKTDAVFLAAVLGLLGATAMQVLEANTPIASIPAGSFPCWAVEQGDGVAQSIGNAGDDEGMVIGHAEQQFSSTLELALVWKDNDRARAKAARAQLPSAMAQLLLRNPQPGGIAGAWLESWQPDRGGMHPVQVWRCTIRGEYSVLRA